MILWFCIKPRPQTFNTMADFDVDNPAFEPDDWEEDIGNDDDPLHCMTLRLTACHQRGQPHKHHCHCNRSSSRPQWMTTTTGLSKRASLQPLAETPEGLSWLMGSCGWRPTLTSIWSTKGRGPPVPSQLLPTSLAGELRSARSWVCGLGPEKIKLAR